MVSTLYVGAVAFYFLVLYPYIFEFVSWAVWAIEGLPPPSYQQDFAAGRLVPAPPPSTSSSPSPSPYTAAVYEAPLDPRARMREEVRRMAKERAGEEREDNIELDDLNKKDCPLTRSKSWIKGHFTSMRRTRLDQIMEGAAAAEEGQSSVMEEINFNLDDTDEVATRAYYPAPSTPGSAKGKDRADSPPRRTFAAQPKDARRYGGVGLVVYLRVMAGQLFFNAVFCALPFWFKFLKCSFTQQLMLPPNMHDQD